MFVTLPNFRYPMPADFGAPQAEYWRTLTTSTNSAWFVLRVRVHEHGQRCSRTFLFWWDSDVIDAIVQLQPEVIESLVRIMPRTWGRQTKGNAMLAALIVTEIWLADDPEGGLPPVVAFVYAAGVERAGMLAEPVSAPLSNRRLVARVGAAPQPVPADWAWRVVV